ncbi:MAG: ribonuclease P protein component [Parvularculaceae bacterium]|nr:ribonuclease P protein component [Parvularculaceae bacterium]
MRKRADFVRARSGVRVQKSGFTLQSLPNDQGFARVGVTVTKKIGNAVVRNRVKRRFRAAVRELVPLHASPSHDYVIIARGRARRMPYPLLLDELRAALLEAREG